MSRQNARGLAGPEKTLAHNRPRCKPMLNLHVHAYTLSRELPLLPSERLDPSVRIRLLYGGKTGVRKCYGKRPRCKGNHCSYASLHLNHSKSCLPSNPGPRP